MTRDILRGLAACGLLLAATPIPGCADAGETTTIDQAALAARLGDGSPLLILDVRTPDEFERGHIPGAVNIPHTELAGRLAELGPADAEQIVVYCERGGRAEMARSTLQDAGFHRVLHLDGDMRAWRDAELPCDGC